jgi:hypothetical protein
MRARRFRSSERIVRFVRGIPTGEQMVMYRSVTFPSVQRLQIESCLMDHIGPFFTTQNLLIAAQLLTFVVILAYVFISASMLKNIKRQAEQAKEQTRVSERAAVAAQQSAEALIRSERPWVAVDYSRVTSGLIPITFTARNWGRSPAEISFYAVQTNFLASLDNLPRSPRSLADGEFTHHQWLPPGKHIDIYVSSVDNTPEFQKQEFWDQFRNSERIIVYLGLVRYRDAMTQRLLETRFCYWISSTSGQDLQMGGPTGYNRMT